MQGEHLRLQPTANSLVGHEGFLSIFGLMLLASQGQIQEVGQTHAGEIEEEGRRRHEHLRFAQELVEEFEVGGSHYPNTPARMQDLFRATVRNETWTSTMVDNFLIDLRERQAMFEIEQEQSRLEWQRDAQR